MRILHLTDLHFNCLEENRNSRELQEKILQITAREARKRAFHFLAVTGDFTCHGLPEEFEEAEIFLQKLLKAAGLEERQLFFCRGNHDADTQEAGSSFEHYLAFRKRIKGESMGMAYEMNTCSRTSLADFDHAVLLEKEVERVCKERQRAFKIVLMHHQKEVIENQELYGKLEEAADVILSGHLHPDSITAEKRRHTLYLNGLAVCPHLPWIPAGFQALDLEKDNIWKAEPFYLDRPI